MKITGKGVTLVNQVAKAQNLGVVAILIGFVILAALYSRIIPIFEASDEAEHFIYIHTILETGQLPVIQSREEMARQSDPVLRWNNQSHHAPLYYLLSAALIAWSERHDVADYLRTNELIFLRNTVEDNPNKWLHFYTEPTSDTHRAVYFLRAVNVIIGCGTLLLVYRTARTAFNNAYVGLLSMLLVASIPTFIAVNASVTNDALVIFLYTAGLWWAVYIWQKGIIAWRDTLLISAILAAIALTKLTGVSLFAVIYGTLLFGVWRKRWSWQAAIRVALISLLATALLAGWWYVRNWQLYGDPLALASTASIWGRETPLTFAVFQQEVIRIAKTFWMMVGYLHQPVLAPVWFYGYVTLATLGAIVGYCWHLVTKRQAIDAILGFAILVVTGMLLYGTHSVDISYGRLLFPALAAFAAIFAVGWKQLLGGFAFIVILPITALAILAPLYIIPKVYQKLEPVSTVPESAIPVGWSAAGLEIVAVDVPLEPVHPGDELRIDVYFRGNHPLNPVLLITAIDTINITRLDHMEIYPGMAATDDLPDEQHYRMPIFLQLGEPTAIQPPRLVMLNLEWQDAGDEAEINFENGQSVLEIQGPVLVDPRYKPVGRATPVEARFDEAIQPDYYCLTESGLRFVWKPLQPIAEDWTLTIQVFDSQGNLVTQTDGTLWWYPTSRWVADTRFDDWRDVDLPDDFAVGDYQIRVGWYRQVDDSFIRMNVTNGEAVDNLLVLPETFGMCD